MPSPPSPPAPPVPHASATHQTRCAREGHTLLRSLRARRHRQRLRVRRSPPPDAPPANAPIAPPPDAPIAPPPDAPIAPPPYAPIAPPPMDGGMPAGDIGGGMHDMGGMPAAGADNLGVALLTVQPRAHPAQRFLDVGSHHNHIAFDPGTGYGGWLIGLVGHQGFCGTPRQGLGMLDWGGSGSIWTPVRCG
jgi:hypothetical protein